MLKLAIVVQGTSAQPEFTPGRQKCGKSQKKKKKDPSQNLTFEMPRSWRKKKAGELPRIEIYPNNDQQRRWERGGGVKGPTSSHPFRLKDPVRGGGKRLGLFDGRHAATRHRESPKLAMGFYSPGR